MKAEAKQAASEIADLERAARQKAEREAKQRLEREQGEAKVDVSAVSAREAALLEQVAALQRANEQAASDRELERKRVQALEKQVAALAVAEINEKALVRTDRRALGRGGSKVAWLCEWNGLRVVLLELNEVRLLCFIASRSHRHAWPRRVM